VAITARFLRIHPADNVLTVTVAIPEGDSYTVADTPCTATRLIPVGFKVAAGPISANAKVIKYGVSIGTATQDIACGEVIHTHNLRSDYLPTHRRGDFERATGMPPVTE
jgi:altronate dehydratase small subunit